MTRADEVRYLVKVPPDLEGLQALFAAAWGPGDADYGKVLERSFTWVSAHADDKLVGFVNIAWDGGVHFFMLDTTVHPDWQRRGIGTRLVKEAIEACRGHGHHLHVDSNEDLMRDFYIPAGFAPTPAGIAWVGEPDEGSEQN